VTLLLDTGPVVAAIDRSDNHHDRCATLLESAEGPLLIPTTGLVEVCWLVEERPDIEAAFLEAIAAGEFEHVPVTAADIARMAELVRAHARRNGPNRNSSRGTNCPRDALTKRTAQYSPSGREQQSPRPTAPSGSAEPCRCLNKSDTFGHVRWRKLACALGPAPGGPSCRVAFVRLAWSCASRCSRCLAPLDP